MVDYERKIFIRNIIPISFRSQASSFLQLRDTSSVLSSAELIQANKALLAKTQAKLNAPSNTPPQSAKKVQSASVDLASLQYTTPEQSENRSESESEEEIDSQRASQNDLQTTSQSDSQTDSSTDSQTDSNSDSESNSQSESDSQFDSPQCSIPEYESWFAGIKIDQTVASPSWPILGSNSLLKKQEIKELFNVFNRKQPMTLSDLKRFIDIQTPVNKAEMKDFDNYGQRLFENWKGTVKRVQSDIPETLAIDAKKIAEDAKKLFVSGVV